MGDYYNSQVQGKGYPGGNVPYGYPGGMHCNMSRAYMDLSEEERKCLEERKYWCFLLSRLVLFLSVHDLPCLIFYV